MLKHFSKSFLVSLLSWSLLTMQTSIAFGAVTETQGEMSTDSKGNITTKTNYHFEKITDSDMLASITMLAGGMIASRMYISYKPITPDVMIAAAGGAAFIAGEVLTNVSFKGKIDSMTVEVERKNDQTVYEEQVQRLQDLKKSYEEVKSTTKTKKTLQLAAAAAFGAAALTSTYMAVMEASQVGLCRGTIATAKAKLTTCIAAGTATGVGSTEAASCKVCLPKIQSYELMFNKYNLSRMPPGLSIFQDKKTDAPQAYLLKSSSSCIVGAAGAVVSEVGGMMESVCKPAVLLEQSDEVAGKPVQFSSLNPVVKNNLDDLIKNILKTPQITSNSQPNYFEKILNIFFPKAEAGWLPLLGLGASTAAAFFLITGTMATELDMLLFIPKNRAIAFGLLATLSYMASKSSDNVIGKVDEYIKRIETILTELETSGKGIKASNIKKHTIASVAYSPTTIAGASLATSTPCATSEANSKCTTLSSQLSSSSGFSNLPSSLQDLANQAMTVGDGVSGTSNISGSTLAAAESFGNKQAAIAKSLKSTQEKLQKISKDKFTPEEQQKELLKGLGAKIKKDLDKKGMSASGFMASIGSSPIDSSLPASNVAGSGTGSSSSGAVGTVDISAPAGSDLKLDFKNEPEGLALNDVGAGSGKAPEYEFNESSIHQETGPSIFELISNRYIKSGYPKLLEVEPSKK